jgi:hypothetical protein
LSKRHIILRRVESVSQRLEFDPAIGMARQMPLGPGGPGGFGGPPPGGGWHIAIPIVAILGITAIGMHW